MTETYCVVAQVGGFATKADHLDGSIDDHNDKILSDLEANVDVKVLSKLVRDDGTGEIAVVWKPEAEADGTMAWHKAKESVEEVKSAVQGAGLALLNPVTVELREPGDAGGAVKAKAKKSTAKTAEAKKSTRSAASSGPSQSRATGSDGPPTTTASVADERRGAKPSE